MFGAPNLWSVDSNGKFTHMWETDAYKQALAFDADLFKAGVFHPDSSNLNVVTAATAFEARQGAFVVTGSATGLLGHSRHRGGGPAARRRTSICSPRRLRPA